MLALIMKIANLENIFFGIKNIFSKSKT